jgi:hypothetical protein
VKRKLPWLVNAVPHFVLFFVSVDLVLLIVCHSYSKMEMLVVNTNKVIPFCRKVDEWPYQSEKFSQRLRHVVSRICC